MGEEKLICLKCNIEMVPTEINLEYLGHRMTHEFLSCPNCNNLYIPEELVVGKMHKVETELEDK
ncbi:MAG: DVU_1557 family redox protein [Bacillota bacterium]|jgi:uncharacterized protein with PIN domain